MGAARVEVPQQSTVPLLKRLSSLLEVASLGVDVVCDETLDRGLGAAVGVGWPNGAVLGDGDHVLEAGGVTVNCSRGGEDDVGDVVALHGSEEGNAATDIYAVVFERDLTGLTNGLPTKH